MKKLPVQNGSASSRLGQLDRLFTKKVFAIDHFLTATAWIADVKTDSESQITNHRSQNTTAKQSFYEMQHLWHVKKTKFFHFLTATAWMADVKNLVRVVQESRSMIAVYIQSQLSFEYCSFKLMINCLLTYVTIVNNW